MTTHKSCGFTLLEMMIVVGLIAILATLALPSYISSIAGDQIKESLALVEPLKEPVEIYYKALGELPVNNKEASIPESNKLLGNFVTSIELKKGAFHITFGNKAVAPLKGQILSVRAITVKDSSASPMSWVCGGSAVPVGMVAAGENLTSVKENLLPMACRNFSGKAK
jgi:type IV pilus assembly protein PilA